MEYQGFPTAEELAREKTEDPNLFRALVFGLAAGAIGAAIWFGLVVITHWAIGIVAILIGGFVGGAVVRGAGNKYGRSLQALSVAITLAAMVVAEYFIIRHLVVELLAAKNGPTYVQNIPLFLPLDVAWDLVVAGIKDDPIQLLFWAIALWTAFRVPLAPEVAAPVATPAAPPSGRAG